MTTRWSRYFSCSATRSGISARHGGHQVAQKLRMTTLPRSDAEDSSRPSRSLTVNAGAVAGLRKKRSVDAFAALGRVGRRVGAVRPAVELPGIARRGPRQQDGADDGDEEERASWSHSLDKCKLKPCRFKPCSSMPAACWSIPTGRASARRWRATGSTWRRAALASAEPHAKRRIDTGETIKATNDQQRGWTYFNLVLTEAGVALSDATVAALARAARLPSGVQSVGVGPRRSAAVARRVARARAAAGGRVERQRRAASRLRSPRADRRVRRHLRLAPRRGGEARPALLSDRARTVGRARRDDDARRRPLSRRRRRRAGGGDHAGAARRGRICIPSATACACDR